MQTFFRQTQSAPIDLARAFESNWSEFFDKRDRALAHYRATESDLEDIAVMDGSQPGLSAFTACNAKAKSILTESLSGAYISCLNSEPNIEHLLVTIVVDEFFTSDEKTKLRISALRELSRRICMKMAPDYVGVVELSVIANSRHWRGGKLLTPHTHAIVSGRNILANAKAVRDAYNRLYSSGMPGFPAVHMKPIAATAADLQRVVAYLFKPPHKQTTKYLDPITGRTNLHASEKGDRPVRFLRLFQLLSMLQQPSITFAGGRGMAWKNAAMKAAHSHLRERTAWGNRVDQLEWVANVWDELMRRLKLSRFALPKIEV